MRRTLTLLVTATLLFAACSSDDDNASENSSTETTSSEETGTTDDVTDETTDETTDTGSVAPRPTNPDKPEVDVPDEIPTELQVTVIEEGTGPAAEPGDTVIVDYIGVRTRDGVEFDNSYDPRQPGIPASAFPVVLGEGRVIQGWDEGLIGVQAGSRIRLDIPSDLAYGPAGSGDIIGPDEALTFLIDVRAVVSPSAPPDAPSEPGVETTSSVDGVQTEDLIEGTGEMAEAGQTVVIDYVLFRGDNGVVLTNGWGSDVSPFPLTEGTFPVLVEGIPGMKVGGRRAITFPPEYPDFGFGPEGAPTEGLPANTPVIIVVDLLGVYGEPES